MTRSTSATRSPASGAGALEAAGSRKAIPAGLLVFILTVGVFGILNTEMGIVGVIPYVAERYGVSVPDAGLLVSAFALVVAVAGPTMPLLFSKVNRKTVMLLSLGVFSACNVFAMFAPSFAALLAARVVPAAFHPLYVSMAMAVAQQAGRTPAESAKASARVFVGVSAGMVVGAPVAGMLAGYVAFPVAMGFFAVVTVAALAMTALLVPSMPVEGAVSYRSQLAILKKPLFLVSLLVAASLNAAMFGFYSFMSDYLGVVAGMETALVSGVLFAYGLANIAGNVLSGRMLGVSSVKTMLAAPVVLGLLYVAVFAAGGATVVVGALFVVLGVLVGVVNTCDQYLVSRAAPEAPDFANGLFLTATNLGTTLGTSLAGAFISAGGTRLSVLATLPLVALGLALTVARVRLDRRAKDAASDGKRAAVGDGRVPCAAGLAGCAAEGPDATGTPDVGGIPGAPSAGARVATGGAAV